MMLDAIALDDDLEWEDEWSWSPREEGVDYSITGALIVEPSAAKQAGRPITLRGAQDRAWLTRATLTALQAKLATTAPMSLTLWDGRAFTVGWRYADTPIEAIEVRTGAGFFVATIRLRVL